MKQSLSLFVGALTCCFSVPCAANLIVGQDYRALYLFAQGDSDFGSSQELYSQDAASVSDDPYVPWLDSATVSSFQAQSALATAAGQIASSITSTSIGGTASVSGEAWIVDETGYAAEAMARGLLQVGFSVSDSSLWRLTASLATTGTGQASVLLTEGLNANGNVIFTSTAGSVDHTLLLAPGDYSLRILADVSAVVWFNTTLSGTAAFTAEFNQVPEPSSFALVGAVVGGLFMGRRCPSRNRFSAGIRI